MAESLEDIRRKRLRYRSWHRGTRELDLILGRFADAHMGELDTAALDDFEALLEAADAEVFAWINGRAPAPLAFQSKVGDLIRNFKYHS